MATYTDPTTVIPGGMKTNAVQPGALILLIGGILAIVMAAVFFVQTRSIKAQTDTTTTEVTVEQNKVKALQDTATELTTLATQAKGLHVIFDNQKRWPAVLDKVAERLHKQMTVSSIQITEKGLATVSGTVPDYVVYAKVFQAFTDAEGQKYFLSARPTATTKGTAGITFTFALQLQPSVLLAGSLSAPAPTPAS